MLIRTLAVLIMVAYTLPPQIGPIHAESASPAAASNGTNAVAAAKPLSGAEKELFEAGEILYATICGSCHQLHGKGQEGLAPPLVDSEWVLGSAQRLVRISLQGMRGRVMVKGKRYEMEMPGVAVLDDEQIAALLTYVRRAWNHTASPILPAAVAKIRAETEKREQPWTAEELKAIP